MACNFPFLRNNLLPLISSKMPSPLFLEGFSEFLIPLQVCSPDLAGDGGDLISDSLSCNTYEISANPDCPWSRSTGVGCSSCCYCCNSLNPRWTSRCWRARGNPCSLPCSQGKDTWRSPSPSPPDQGGFYLQGVETSMGEGQKENQTSF